MNLLRIQAFWSHYRLRRQNNLLNYLLHQQLRITSVISSLRRMLLNWPDRPANLMPVITQLLDELRDPATDKYRLARLLQQIAPQDHGLPPSRLLAAPAPFLLALPALQPLAAAAGERHGGQRAPAAARHLAGAPYRQLRSRLQRSAHLLCIVIGCAY